MATAQEAYSGIQRLLDQVHRTLRRCLDTPAPSADRDLRLREFDATGRDLRRVAEQLWESISSENTAAVHARRAEIEHEQVRLNQLLKRLSEAELDFARRVAELNSERNADGVPSAGREERLRILRADFENTRKQLTARIEDTRANVLPALKELLDAAQREDAEYVEEARRREHVELTAVHEECGRLLDRVGTFEASLRRQNEGDLAKSAAAEFKNNVNAFGVSADYHKNASELLLKSLGGLLLAAIAFIGWLLWSVAACKECPKLTDLGELERFGTSALSHLGAVLFMVVVFRYVANLHRAHVEQHVIYRDRIAALGVADVLLAAAPHDARIELLKTLTNTYINFDQNAFRHD